MIISAINIWKKYGVTMNHGSGNYLNWYSTVIFSELWTSPPAFATPENENGADGNGQRSQEENVESTGTNGAINTGLEQSKDTETESIDDTNTDSRNSGTRFDNGNTFDNGSSDQSDSKREEQQSGNQETLLKDDFDSAEANNQITNTNKGLQSPDRSMNNLFTESNTPLLKHGRLSIDFGSYFISNYYKDKDYEEISQSVTACVETVTADGKTVSANPNCLTGFNSTHEFILNPGIVKIDIKYDPRIAPLDNTYSSIGYIEEMEIKACGADFKAITTGSEPSKLHAFNDVNKYDGYFKD